MLTAGFYRKDITPREGGIPLAGYGSTDKRPAADIWNRLSANAVALGDENGVQMIEITNDLINNTNEMVEIYREKIQEATGVTAERIFVNATHTHSAPDVIGDFSQRERLKRYADTILIPGVVEAAVKAVADLKPAKLSYTKGIAGHDGLWLNFVKHYYMVKREDLADPTPDKWIPVGDNYGDMYARDRAHYEYVGHEEEADHSVQLLKFTRENDDDILLVNFAAHATITGGYDKPHMSSDFPGVLRDVLEKMLPGTHVAFIQGAAGNLNPHSRMWDEAIPGVNVFVAAPGYDRRAESYGEVLAYCVKNIINKGFTESKTDTLKFEKYFHTGKLDHSNDDRAPEAQKIWDIYKDTGYTDEIREMCWAAGFNSPYQVGAILRKKAAGEEDTFEMNAIRIGDAAVVTAPFELFNATGMYIKERSPFDVTFVNAYSCGSHSYLPSANAYHDCYEWNQNRYEPGTAEIIQDEYVEMLKKLAD